MSIAHIIKHSATVRNTYFISDRKIRIIRAYEKNGLKYVNIRLTQFFIYKHSLTNEYRKLVNVIVGCFQVYGKASRAWTVDMVRVKVSHTHTTVGLLNNYTVNVF